MCQWNAGEFWCGNRGTDARNDLEWNPSHRERQRFFRAAPEDKWISALEPHHALAGTRSSNHEPVNRFLPDPLPPRALADAKALRFGESSQRRCIHERVVEHEIGVFEIGNSAPRPEIWISRSCADEGDGGTSRDPGSGIRDPMFDFVRWIRKS